MSILYLSHAVINRSVGRKKKFANVYRTLKTVMNKCRSARVDLAVKIVSMHLWALRTIS